MELTDRLNSASCVLTPLNPRHATLAITLRVNERHRFGRRTDCEQCFPTDFRISGVHASLLLEDGHFFIEDSSQNGTFVNSERVARGTRRSLASGDFFYLVIPSVEALQAGYTGSLTSNFVGYRFEQAPRVAAAPAAAPPPRGLMPRSSPDTPRADAAPRPVAYVGPTAAWRGDAAASGAAASGAASSAAVAAASEAVSVEHVSFAAWWHGTMASASEPWAADGGQAQPLSLGGRGGDG
jgi:predicted component of type VI protein secretion system